MADTTITRRERKLNPETCYQREGKVRPNLCGIRFKISFDPHVHRVSTNEKGISQTILSVRFAYDAYANTEHLSGLHQIDFDVKTKHQVSPGESLLSHEQTAKVIEDAIQRYVAYIDRFSIGNNLGLYREMPRNWQDVSDLLKSGKIVIEDIEPDESDAM